MRQQVFISYRHESPQHARAVRRLGELLRQAKVSVVLDQFYLDEHPGGPDVGWPKWCEDCATESACVLIIASEGWFEAYEKPVALGGLGAASEANVFRNTLYRERGNNTRIRLAFLNDVPVQIPDALLGWQQFRPFASDDELDHLIRWVAERLGVENIDLPTIAWPEPLPFRPDLADRGNIEWPAITELIAGRSRNRILMYEGASGLGKSALVGQAAIYARNSSVPVVYVDCKGAAIDLARIVGQFDADLDLQLPNFSRERQTHLLRIELRSLRRPVLVIFDTYEHVLDNQTISDWVNQQLLAEVETARGLLVVISGQRVPDYREMGWRDLVRHIHLEPITQLEHWKPWIERHYPDFQRMGDLPTVLTAAEGNPAVVSGFCEATSKP